MDIEIENSGTVAIDFQLYLSGNPFGKSVTLVPIGELANEGDAIYGKNNSSTTTGSWVVKFL